MKYMLIMRATDAALAASAEVDFEEVVDQMGAYNEAMHDAGVLAGGEGLTEPSAEENFVLDFSSTPPIFSEEPYGPTESLFNGFWILNVPSREEARQWAERCPLGPGMKLEVRRVHGDEEIADLVSEDNQYIAKEKFWRQEEAERAQREG
ncbi:YciI family protein [Brachybacterium paraconglomeratum]|uniref:YciI family protein n=1 Tax=Brachybacterium paraconglomeratum TaxID=173362 RepID=UPI003514F589